MNFEDDIQREVERILRKLNVRYKARNYGDALTDFLTIGRKYIQKKQRKIKISNELNERLQSDHLKWDQLFNIIDVARQGGDLNKYQSERLYQAKFHDRLLNNWEIHHLHLSGEPNKKDKRFNKRTEHLVFALVKPETIYFLDFASHDQPNIFAEEKWIRIISHNWPHLLEPYDGDPVFSNGQKITTALRNEMWGKGYTIGFTKVDDKSYIDAGAGTTVSGHSIKVIMHRNDIVRWLHMNSQVIRECQYELEEAFANEYRLSPERIIYKVRLEPRIQIYEETTGDVLVNFPNCLTKEE